MASTQKGLSSFSQKKCLTKNNTIITNWFKNFVQIIVPILSLIVVILAITLKINSLNSKNTIEIEAIEQKQRELKNSIDRLEMKTKNIQDSILGISKN